MPLYVGSYVAAVIDGVRIEHERIRTEALTRRRREMETTERLYQGRHIDHEEYLRWRDAARTEQNRARASSNRGDETEAQNVIEREQREIAVGLQALCLARWDEYATEVRLRHPTVATPAWGEYTRNLDLLGRDAPREAHEKRRAARAGAAKATAVE